MWKTIGDHQLQARRRKTTFARLALGGEVVLRWPSCQALYYDCTILLQLRADEIKHLVSHQREGLNALCSLQLQEGSERGREKEQKKEKERESDRGVLFCRLDRSTNRSFLDCAEYSQKIKAHSVSVATGQVWRFAIVLERTVADKLVVLGCCSTPHP